MNSVTDKTMQLLDGRLPHYWYKCEYVIIRAICRRQEPIREKDERSRLSASVSDSLVACWSCASERPSIEEVVDKLENILKYTDDDVAVYGTKNNIASERPSVEEVVDKLEKFDYP
jgi:hypothetical protein